MSDQESTQKEDAATLHVRDEGGVLRTIRIDCSETNLDDAVNIATHVVTSMGGIVIAVTSCISEKILDDTQYRYSPKAGTYDASLDFRCGVCKCIMKKIFNQKGPTSVVSAMAYAQDKDEKYFSYYDLYVCSHKDKDWHKRAVSIRKEAHKTSSSKLKNLLLEEAFEIVTNKEIKK